MGSGRRRNGATMCPFMDRSQRSGGPFAGRVVRPEPVMTLPRSAADVLAGHVLFEIEVIDRVYLDLYQPRLQHGAGIAAFFVGHRGHRFASSALMAPRTAAFTADISHFIAARGLDLVRFAAGQRKDGVTAGYLQRAGLDDRGWCPRKCCTSAWRRMQVAVGDRRVLWASFPGAG